jgi:putative endonuclease
MSRNGEIGQQTEKFALEYLQERGLSLIQRNYRCRYGEIDLIMTEDDTLVFVEVRFRSNPRYTQSAESVDRHKQRKLLRAAESYLQRSHPTTTPRCRFDVIALKPSNGYNAGLEVDWIKNAFHY